MRRYYLKKKAVLPDGQSVGDAVMVFVGEDGEMSLDTTAIPEPVKTLELLVEVDEEGRFVRPPVTDLEMSEVLQTILESG